MGELKCALQERLDLSTDNRRMYWAAFTTVLFGFLRSSEYTAPSPSHFDKDRTLLCSDLTIDSNGYRLHIKKSKTNPFRLGVDLFLSRSHHSVCPVKALEKYMARSRSRASDLPLFSHADGSFLTPLRLTSTSYLYPSVFTTQIGLQRRPIRRSQLPDQSSNNSSCRWPARLAHKNSRSLVVRLLQTIHPTKCQGYLFCGKRARKSLHSDRLSIVVC